MPELTCNSMPICDRAFPSIGTMITPDPDLKVPHEKQTFLRVYSLADDIYISKIQNHWHDNHVKTVELTLLEAYQLRDFLNKNLDNFAWELAEQYHLNENQCKALAKFKKVYYEDEINNTETNNPEAEETEAKVSE